MADQVLKVAALQKERRRIEDLRPAEYNPRKLLKPGDDEYEKLKASVETFGYVDPIIVNKDGTVIGGHQRLNVLKDLGYEEADVAVVDLNKNDEKALNIALNKISGEWDNEKLAAIFADFDVEGYTKSITGFSDDEIESLNASLADAPQFEDIDEIGSKSEIGTHTLKIDRTIVELSEDEYKELMAELERYVDMNGVSFGFVRWLLHED